MGLLTGCWWDCSLQRGILGVRTITRSQSEENMNFQGDMVKCCLATEMCSEKCFIIVQTQCVLTQNNTGMMSVGENPIAPRWLCEAWPSSSLWVTALFGEQNFVVVVCFWPGTLCNLPISALLRLQVYFWLRIEISIIVSTLSIV